VLRGSWYLFDLWGERESCALRCLVRVQFTIRATHIIEAWEGLDVVYRLAPFPLVFALLLGSLLLLLLQPLLLVLVAVAGTAAVVVGEKVYLWLTAKVVVVVDEVDTVVCCCGPFHEGRRDEDLQRPTVQKLASRKAGDKQ